MKWSKLFLIRRVDLPILLVLLLSSLFSACGETNPTLVPAGSPLSTSGTTIALTTTSPSPVTTTPGKTLTDPLHELWSLIPDMPEFLAQLTFNDFVAFRKLAGIPDNVTTDELLNQKKDLFTSFNAVSQNFAPTSHLLPVTYFTQLPSKLGYDFLQADYEAEGGVAPAFLSLAKGRFDFTGIEKTFTTAGATGTVVGNYKSFGFDKLDLTNSIQRILLSPVELVLLPDRQLLGLSRSTNTAEALVKMAAGNKTQGGIAENLQVKALLEVFDKPLAIFISNQVFSPRPAGALTPQTPGGSSLPVPVLGGFAYNATAPGQDYYIVANYYSTPAEAKSALGMLENAMRNGTSLASRQPYSNYFSVEMAGVQGNIVVFKLKLKQAGGLTKFVFARDLPVFWT